MVREYFGITYIKMFPNVLLIFRGFFANLYFMEVPYKGDEKGYVFCNRNGTELSEGAINTILSDIAKVDSRDCFYSQLTPGNVRKSLAGFLLENGYPLHKIFYLMDIEGYKLDSYISNAGKWIFG